MLGAEKGYPDGRVLSNLEYQGTCLAISEDEKSMSCRRLSTCRSEMISGTSRKDVIRKNTSVGTRSSGDGEVSSSESLLIYEV
jgi:hypothetical protein